MNDDELKAELEKQAAIAAEVGWTDFAAIMEPYEGGQMAGMRAKWNGEARELTWIRSTAEFDRRMLATSARCLREAPERYGPRTN